jgi:hypothetical protein
MATITLTRLYDNHQDALVIVQALEQAGFPRDEVSIVSSNAGNRWNPATRRGDTAATAADEGTSATGAGAAIGAALGGTAGLLAGLGALAIPGVGPVVAAGWLVATLAGAGAGALVGGAAGGLVDALTNAGVSEADANVYAEGVRRGGTLLMLRTDTARQPEAERILDQRTTVNPMTRRREYEAAGWNRFDPKAPEYVPSDSPPTSPL